MSSFNILEYGYQGDESSFIVTEDTVRKLPDQMIAVKEFWHLINNPIPAGTECYSLKTALGEDARHPTQEQALGEDSFYYCPSGTIPGCVEEVTQTS